MIIKTKDSRIREDKWLIGALPLSSLAEASWLRGGVKGIKGAQGFFCALTFPSLQLSAVKLA